MYVRNARAPDGAPALTNVCALSPQPAKSLYTTVRELIENSLDAAESIRRLPEIAVRMYVSVARRRRHRPSRLVAAVCIH